MQVEYHPLLKLKLRHDYFPEGNCPVVKVVPTPATQAIMQQLGIRMVERDYGVELFYNNGSNSQGRFLDVAKDQVVRLAYILRTTDPLFYNYTIVPPELFKGMVPYYSNLDGTTSFLAHDLPLLPAVPAHFQITANAPGSDLTITDELSNTLYQYPDPEGVGDDLFHPIAPLDEDGSAFNIDLSRDPPGRYTLWEADTPLTTVHYQPPTWQRGDLATVTLYLGDTGETGVHVLRDGVVEPAEFTASFTARATTWRYHFVDPEGRHEGFKLMEADTELVIAEPDTPPLVRELQDGSKALVLTAKEAIPLRARPELRFELSVRARGNNRELKIPLPSADANRISQEHPAANTNNAASAAANTPPEGGANQEDTVFYSDLYVYL